MRNTYANFRTLAAMYTGPSDLSQVALQYGQDRDPVKLAYVFCELYPFTLTQVGQYFYLTDSDMASYAVEELHDAMCLYRADGGAQIQTLYSRFLNNRLREETQRQSRHRRKANNGAANYEQAVDPFQGGSEVGYRDFEFLYSLDQSGKLSANELRYCRIISDAGAGEKEVRDIDVAALLGMTPAGLHYLKKSLAKKLQSLGYRVATA